MKLWSMFIIILVLAAFIPPLLTAENYFERLEPDQPLAGFTVKNVYENGTGQLIGARFVSDDYGFVLDVMRIQSVPQAFFWVKTKATTSMGRPHAGEHLLLGKGNRARYVSAQEDMTLSSSTAATGQTITYYHFNTVGGTDAFYEIFEAKLNALINPDFTDEEIRREVCHIGVVEDPDTGELSLDEKGSVYTEMVSSYEKPWYHYGSVSNVLVYGPGHPLSNSSGGDPEVMRDMTARHMWDFIRDNYRLGNMGAIAAIPDEIEIDSFLTQIAAILPRCQQQKEKPDHIGLTDFDFPDPQPAPPGTVKLTTYPSDKDTDPGYLMLAWPLVFDLELMDENLLALFWPAFTSGPTSNLYKLLINSETRQLDLGARYVWGSIDHDQGTSPFFSIGDLDNQHISKKRIDEVRALVHTELQRLHEMPDNSAELLAFNREIASRLVEYKKEIANYLNSPPMFGFRSGAGPGWLQLMADIEQEPGFRKSLIRRESMAKIERMIESGQNIWAPLIDKAGLLAHPPYAVGCRPDPAMIPAAQKSKEERIAGYINDFKKKYGTDDAQAAMAQYKAEFDANTRELEIISENQPMPQFIANPPLTLDESLQYETMMLANDIPLFAAAFENMTSATFNLYLDLDVIPDSLLMYAPVLPALLTEIGVYRDEQAVTYEEMSERLRQEVLNFRAFFDHNEDGTRNELVISGQGSDLSELRHAIGWMDAGLFTPYLSRDNIARLRDVVDQWLSSLRGRTKSPEEYWVDEPADAYRYQDKPLFLSTNCFLVERHHLLRLKFQLMEFAEVTDQIEFISVMENLRELDKIGDREALIQLLNRLKDIDSTSVVLPQRILVPAEMAANAAPFIREMATEMLATLPDIPDDNLAGDWSYLCQMVVDGVNLPLDTVLDNLDKTLKLLRQADLARAVMISNSDVRSKILPNVNELVGKLRTSDRVPRQDYPARKRIIERLQTRLTDAPGQLTYVGLRHDGTQNGVIIFTAKIGEPYESSEDNVLNCLAGKLYSGGGAHGFFMQTWAAGLAYSNGYSFRQGAGQVRYYAERCPDVAETMKYVVNIIKNANVTEELVEYAVAQVFAYSRAPSPYESRGIEMAADYEDGTPPDVIRTFRQKVIAMRNDPNLRDKLTARLETVHGPVMLGYGDPLAKSTDGVYFLIGPESQFEMMARSIAANEGEQPIYRLYPRDYWLVD